MRTIATPTLVARSGERRDRRGLVVIDGSGRSATASAPIDLARLDAQGRLAASRVIRHLDWETCWLRIVSHGPAVSLRRTTDSQIADATVDSQRRVRLNPATRTHLAVMAGDCLLLVPEPNADLLTLVAATTVVDALQDHGVLP